VTIAAMVKRDPKINIKKEVLVMGSDLVKYPITKITRPAKGKTIGK
jgi:hypothetical protein